MFVSEIIGDVKEVIGKCSDTVAFSRISDAVKLANNGDAGNDWNTGIMDLCVCDGCVTLPADVGTILGVLQAGQPTLIRDQWYQFHINGPGVSGSCGAWSYTDELGPVCTYRDPTAPVRLVADVENSVDSNCLLRVFGWDENGKRIYSDNGSGVLEDGFLVPTVYGFAIPSPTATPIARIDRIHKQATNGQIRLIAVDQTTLESRTLIGHYLPWETVPSYRRIRVGDRNWIRIKYRRRDLEVRGAIDWINIENREALILLVKAVKFRRDNQIEMGKAFESEGLRLLSNEASTLRPPAMSGPQIVFSDGAPVGEFDRMFY